MSADADNGGGRLLGPLPSAPVVARLGRWVSLTLLGLVMPMLGPAGALAQTQGYALSGTVVDAHNNGAVAGARVVIVLPELEVTCTLTSP